MKTNKNGILKAYPDDPSGKIKMELVSEPTQNWSKMLSKSITKRLFVDEYQNPHIAITVSGHIETLPIKSKRFRNWLANIFYKTTGLVIKSPD